MTLPTPEPGLVISYSYLWRHESAAGQTEGVKDRPCAVVLVVRHNQNADRVTVAPITHTLPADPAAALEIPLKVKQHLGLDDSRSWVVLGDLNAFDWPGYDIRPVPGDTDRYDYGMLPPNFYAQINRRLAELHRKGGIIPIERNE